MEENNKMRLCVSDTDLIKKEEVINNLKKSDSELIKPYIVKKDLKLKIVGLKEYKTQNSQSLKEYMSDK